MAEISLNNRECRKDGLPDSSAMCGKRNTQPKKMTVGDHLNNEDGAAVREPPGQDAALGRCRDDRSRRHGAGFHRLHRTDGDRQRGRRHRRRGRVRGRGRYRDGARRINKGGVSLINVSLSFVKAVKQSRAAAESKDEDEDEPAPPQKKKRPSRD